MLLTNNNWLDYKVLDAGDGEKLEQWGKYTLRRPDPQTIWTRDSKIDWNKYDAIYHRNATGGGFWEYKNQLPESWVISYKKLKFNIKPTGFKHTGLFPEQASNWEWLIDLVSSHEVPVTRVLNLFAYTGGATVACAAAGAEVVHVDASKGMNQIAKDNVVLSNLDGKARFIQDDVVKFVQREIRRGNKYDGIIMDPPAYGRGASKEIWEIEKSLGPLVEDCAKLLSDKPLFFLINSYANDLSNYSIENILKIYIQEQFGGKVYSGTLGLPVERKLNKSQLILPCGNFTRWEKI